MGRGRGGRKFSPNRGKNQQRKGPQAPADERLWRRLSQWFKDDEELWSKAWSGKEAAEFLSEKENLANRFSLDAKAERAFFSEMDAAVAEARKKQERFVVVEEKKVRLRRGDEIEEIESNVAQWKGFVNRHCRKISAGIKGMPALRVGEELYHMEDGESKLSGYVSNEDAELYELLERVWLAHLHVEDYPQEFTLKSGESILKYGEFDLLNDMRFIAKRRSGLRFPDSEPAMALLLYNAGKLDHRGLLNSRLAYRRKRGENPFPDNYDESLVAQADALPEVDGDLLVSQGRTDLRHLPFVTIDPHDAKDFDDAVCLVDGTLWVAIADVAHYVNKDSALDNYALNRATSVYLPHKVMPMLPPRLADDLCSLRAGVDRLSMVVAMSLDDDSQISDVRAYEAVIHVDQNISYEQALERDEFAPMFALAKLWQSDELRLNIHNAELRPRVHDDGIKVAIKWPNDATKMIESFMVATNQSVGHLLGKESTPLPYRCHAPPDKVEVEALNARLKALGVSIELPMPSIKTQGQSDGAELSNLLGAWANSGGGGGIDLGGMFEEEEETSDVSDYLSSVLDSEARKDVLDALEKAQHEASSLDETTRRVVDQGLFQLMQRATYSEENLGHFGLNLDAYVHFTSPIRRYPDLIAHRQLKAFIHNQEYSHDLEEVAKLAGHCSTRGYEAKRLEWELVANAYHMHLLDEGLTSQNWQSRVVGLRNPFVFLDLADDGSIQGRMHLKQLSSRERLVIDDYGLEVLPGEPNAAGQMPVLLRLGQKYPCRLRGLDLWQGNLDLAPI